MADVDGEGREAEQDDEQQAGDDGHVAALVAWSGGDGGPHHDWHPWVVGLGSNRITVDSSMVMELKTRWVKALCRNLT